MSIKVVLWRREADDKVGTIRLRVIEQRKPTYKTVSPVKVPVSAWNENTGRVRKTELVDYRQLNSLIEAQLAELDEVGELADVAPAVGSYLNYFADYVESIRAYGSKVKYKTVLNKLRSYLAQRDKADLLFADFTPDFVRNLSGYIYQTLSTNTGNHYLKLYTQILNQAIRERRHTYQVHPFVSAKYTHQRREVGCLSERDVRQIVKVKSSTPRIQRARQAFLFQVFAQGLRVSDLILLRWENVDGECLTYRMYKTDKPMSIYLNANLWKILISAFPGKSALTDKLITEITTLETQVADVLRREYGILDYYNTITSDSIDIPLLRDLEAKRRYLYTVQQHSIHALAKSEYANHFIFSFLDFADFPGIVTGKNVTDAQFKKMRSAKIVYNRHLKELQKVAGIEPILKGHTARHTYTNLMLTSEEKPDVYAVSAALGHSNLATTQKYIAGFNVKLTADLNAGIAARLPL